MGRHRICALTALILSRGQHGRRLGKSPALGFVGAALLLLVSQALIKRPDLYKAPENEQPPPVWIRGLLMLTCTGVSFFHGSNDGRKGIGLVALILVGILPRTYALNAGAKKIDRTSSNPKVPRPQRHTPHRPARMRMSLMN